MRKQLARMWAQKKPHSLSRQLRLQTKSHASLERLEEAPGCPALTGEEESASSSNDDFSMASHEQTIISPGFEVQFDGLFIATPPITQRQTHFHIYRGPNFPGRHSQLGNTRSQYSQRIPTLQRPLNLLTIFQTSQTHSKILA